MNEILTPEDINFLEEKLERASPAPWKVVENEDVDAVWITPELEGNPIALLDYKGSEQNKNDAHFIVSARNYTKILIHEIKNLRKRVLDLIQSNNLELQKRLDLQTELNELKKLMRESNELN